MMKEETSLKLNWQKPELVDLDMQNTQSGSNSNYEESLYEADSS
jgi:hypothetical protein